LLTNSSSAAKALAALPKADRERLVAVIDLLCDTPAAGSALKGEFEGLRRLRVGHYRVVVEWQRSELVDPGGAHRPSPRGLSLTRHHASPSPATW
jgi:mRNA interferase RelE/StbE